MSTMVSLILPPTKPMETRFGSGSWKWYLWRCKSSFGHNCIYRSVSSFKHNRKGGFLKVSKMFLIFMNVWLTNRRWYIHFIQSVSPCPNIAILEQPLQEKIQHFFVDDGVKVLTIKNDEGFWIEYGISFGLYNCRFKN